MQEGGDLLRTEAGVSSGDPNPWGGGGVRSLLEGRNRAKAMRGRQFLFNERKSFAITRNIQR